MINNYYIIWGYRPFERSYAIVQGLTKEEVEKYMKGILSSSFEIMTEDEFDNLSVYCDYRYKMNGCGLYKVDL